MRVPWTARRSNQSILKEISPGISLEGMMLKLKLQYFDHLMRRVDSLEKTLMLGGIEGRRRRGRQDEMVGWPHQLNGHEFEKILGDSGGQGSLALCSQVQFSSVAQSCLTLCNPMNHSTPGLPVHHKLPEFTQTHVHRVGDAIQPSHPLPSPLLLPLIPPSIRVFSNVSTLCMG